MLQWSFSFWIVFLPKMTRNLGANFWNLLGQLLFHLMLLLAFLFFAKFVLLFAKSFGIYAAIFLFSI